MTVAEIPLKVTVAPVKFAAELIVTSVPIGPEVGVIVFVVAAQVPSPLTLKVYGFSVKGPSAVLSLFAIEITAFLVPEFDGEKITVKDT
jgi:hypothetical protein